MGPKAQFERMKDPTRRTTSIVFIVSLVLTLVSIYALHSKLLTIIFLFIQFSAYIWYVLSYIPYGRDLCSKCLKGSFNGFVSSGSDKS